MKFRGFSPRLLAISIATLGASHLVTTANALVITPTWDASILGDPSSAAIQGDLNSAIALYQSKFTDGITVKIYVQEGGGLGSSSTTFYQGSYSSYHTQLIGDATSGDDNTALAQLNSNPFGGANIVLSSATGRAVGFNTPGAISIGAVNDYDGVITLNTSLCFFNHNSPAGGQYDLFAVFLHELDEVMGTTSGVGGSEQVTDLFRYNGAGARSFTTSTSGHAFFSIDGSNNVVEYNQFNRTAGDWGDWTVHNPPQVQDWQGTPGLTINPGESEYRLLDVIGYNRPVPEPATMLALGVGILGLARRRKVR